MSLTSLTSHSLRITLQVVVDDLLEAPWDDHGVTIMPTNVPMSAQKYIREYIRSNEFDFHLLLSSIPLRGKKGKHTYVPTQMKGVITLAEGECSTGQDVWFVETDWEFDEPRWNVDDAQLLSDLFAQLSDGWGEEISQFRFGPCVTNRAGDGTFMLDAPLREYMESDCDSDTMGRFAFNLTGIGARIQ